MIDSSATLNDTTVGTLFNQCIVVQDFSYNLIKLNQNLSTLKQYVQQITQPERGLDIQVLQVLGQVIESVHTKQPVFDLKSGFRRLI